MSLSRRRLLGCAKSEGRRGRCTAVTRPFRSFAPSPARGLWPLQSGWWEFTAGLMATVGPMPMLNVWDAILRFSHCHYSAARLLPRTTAPLAVTAAARCTLDALLGPSPRSPSRPRATFCVLAGAIVMPRRRVGGACLPEDARATDPCPPLSMPLSLITLWACARKTPPPAA